MKKITVPIRILEKYRAVFYHEKETIALVKDVYRYAYKQGQLDEYDRLLG